MTQKCVRDETKRTPTATEWETFLEKRIPELIRRMKEGSLNPGGVNFTLQQVAEGQVMCSILLNPVTPSIQLPSSYAFLVGNRFVENTSDNVLVKISSLGSNFQAWFPATMLVAATTATEVQVNELTKVALDKDIIPEVGEDVVETSIAIVWLMMRYGHLSKEGWYIFYCRDVNGVRRAVSVAWCDDGWLVFAGSVVHPYGWRRGRHVVSRKRCVA